MNVFGCEGQGSHAVLAQFPHDGWGGNGQFREAFEPLKHEKSPPAEHGGRFRDFSQVRRMGHAYHLRLRA